MAIQIISKNNSEKLKEDKTFFKSSNKIEEPFTSIFLTHLKKSYRRY
jgi:hypothetical protein